MTYLILSVITRGFTPWNRVAKFALMKMNCASMWQIALFLIYQICAQRILDDGDIFTGVKKLRRV